MRFLKPLFFVLFVVCSTDYTHGAIKVIEKSQIFEDSNFFINDESFDNGILVYVVCDKDNTTNCKVVQENHPYDEGAYSCQVNLENVYSNSFSVVVNTLGEDKAVLYWLFRKPDDRSFSIKIGTVDFETCEMNSIEVPYANTLTMMYLSHANNFISYDDDSYDVFYPDPSYLPEQADLFKLHIDGNGKIISGPKSANIERGFYRDASTIANRSPAKGYVFVKRNQFKTREEFSANPTFYVMLVKPDGTSKYLAEFTYDRLSNVAGGNNFISNCLKSQDKGHIECTQYDEYGNVLFTTTLATKNFDTDVIKSYNLPSGGMLVLYGATKYNLKENYEKKTGYEVIWIGSNGKEKGRIYDKKFEVPKGMVGVPYIHANGDNGYCATVVISDEYGLTKAEEVPKNLKIVADCFTDNDFLA